MNSLILGNPILRDKTYFIFSKIGLEMTIEKN